LGTGGLPFGGFSILRLHDMASLYNGRGCVALEGEGRLQPALPCDLGRRIGIVADRYGPAKPHVAHLTPLFAGIRRPPVVQRPCTLFLLFARICGAVSGNSLSTIPCTT
jgi:hypothetical protein